MTKTNNEMVNGNLNAVKTLFKKKTIKVFYVKIPTVNNDRRVMVIFMGW